MKISDKHTKAIEDLMPAKERQAFVDKAIDKALKERPRTLKGAADIEIFTDGGSRGNPGPSGGGFVIYKKGKKVAEGSNYYGVKTNNQSEYLALRDALREAHAQFGDTSISCYMDSQLAVEQINGNYKVKSPNVKPLYEEVIAIVTQFKGFQISHVRREENTVADALANKAMDQG